MQDTKGCFNVWHHGVFNPSGVVKGWTMDEAVSLLYLKRFRNFDVDTERTTHLGAESIICWR